jgi:hypothetical protein
MKTNKIIECHDSQIELKNKPSASHCLPFELKNGQRARVNRE